jgi:septum formation protein
MRRLWLASASPRRAQLLASIGVCAELLPPPDIDEQPAPAEPPHEYVRRMALEKARVSWTRLPPPQWLDGAVLAADTAVVLDNRILGKPQDRNDACAMLAALSGREHQVLSAVTVLTADAEYSALSESRVRFAVLSAQQIAAYVDSGEPMDKAGSYAVQGWAALFVEQLQGSYSGVVGLPLAETGRLLQQADVPVWQRGYQTQ